jgi:hypothetical protein
MTRTEIAKKVAKSSRLQETLDTMIHDIHSGMAANINNSGPEAQLEWLEKNADLNAEDVLKQLKNG